MTILGRLFNRQPRPGSLRVANGDAFSSCLEKYGVTAREGEIIRLLLEGTDSKGISEALFISEHTVKNHIHHIYQKLGIRNRMQLAAAFRPAIGEPGAGVAGAAPGENLIPPGASPASLRSRVRRAATSASIALAVLVLAAAAVFVTKPWVTKARGAPSRPVLAVLDFEILSAEPELEKWMTGLPLLLATDLHQSRLIRTLSDDTVFGALKKLGMTERRRFSRDELQRLAQELKADYLLTGSLMKAGGKFVVTAVLQEARTGTAVRTDKIECADEEDLMRKTDGLARLVKSGFNLPKAQTSGDIDYDLRILASPSPLAFKYYAEGRRYHLTGDFERSLLMLGKAVELDPDFAMAYWAMAADARNLGHIADSLGFLKKALDLGERLPENCRERYLIRGDYYSTMEATLPLAAEAYKRVLEDYPDDPVANNHLALLSLTLEDYDAVLRYADVPISQGSDYPFLYYTKAVALLTLDRGAEAVALLRAYHENHPANSLVYDTLVRCLIATNDFTGAEAEIDKAEGLFPDPIWPYLRGTVYFVTRGGAAARDAFRRIFLAKEGPIHLGAYLMLGAVALAEGRYREAEDELRAGLKLAGKIGEPAWDADLRSQLAQTLLEAGKRDDALLEAKQAVESAGLSGSESGHRWTMLLQAIVCLRLKDAAAVERLAREFRIMAASGTTGRPRRDDLLFRGLRELEAGSGREAVRLFESALAELPPGDAIDGRKSFCLYFLAPSREAAGDFAGAAAAYEKVITLPGDRLGWCDLYPRAVLGLATTEEKLGRRAKAIEHYRMFLDLWKNADPGRPEVAEARGRLRALTS